MPSTDRRNGHSPDLGMDPPNGALDASAAQEPVEAHDSTGAARQGLADRVVEQIQAYDVISLDVFDTLVLRAVSAPTDVFALVKLTLLASRDALFHPEVMQTFPTLRVRAERIARSEKLDRQGSSEVTFDEIYATFAALSGATPDLVSLFKQTELDLETRLAYPNPLAKRIWSAALAANKKVVFCSDMYLPGDFVASLLHKCGCDRYDGIYVSCEHGCTKHDGTLFAYVARELGVPLDRILHIGDNKTSDFIRAKHAGCGAIHLRRSPTGNQIVIPDPREGSSHAAAVLSLIQGIIRKRASHGDPADRDPLERIGYNAFGPLLTGFLLWLTAMVERYPPDKILLFARDTYLINKYLRRFLGPAGEGVGIQYVYVSRGAILIPSMTDFSLPRLWHLFSGKCKRTVAYHLRKLGLAPELLTHIIQSAGYESMDDLVENSEPRMHGLLRRLHSLLLQESARQRPLVRRYLKQFVDGARRLTVVDVGWAGNMQGSFLRVLEPLPADLTVRGYYVGLYRTARENDYLGHSMAGWLTHYGDPRGLEEKIWWSGGVELLEFTMCAPHGTTLGYKTNEAGEVEPVLEDSPAEDAANFLRARLQEGAEAFVNDYLELYSTVPAAAFTSSLWANEFYRLVSAPTKGEAELLGDITHSDSAGPTGSRLPIAPRSGKRDQAGIAKDLERAYWKAGFRVRNGRKQSPKRTNRRLP
jgi:predicted HAD superfamily hydrolase